MFICILILTSCEERIVNSKQQDNDTIRVLRTALHQGISGAFMPSASRLSLPYHFGDSVLLTSDILSLPVLLTSIKNQKFKVLLKEEICSMIVADTHMTELPNYLTISKFEKSETGYYVQLRNLSCLSFGGGGSLGLYFKKVGDSLTIVNRAASSIN